MEKAVASGHYLAGFLSYEAGYAFEQKLINKQNYDFPLIYFGVYKAPLTCPPAKSNNKPLFSAEGMNRSKESYFADIEAIRSYIAEGDVYQITYCVKFSVENKGDEYALYDKLKRVQRVPYPAFIKSKDFNILSLSPELFLKKNGTKITTKPMKGTWPRDKDFFSNLIAGLRLKYDSKNRAENIMICDLLRNDLGRIGKNVRAPKLFEVAKYKTLFQMTSTVTADIDKDVDIYKLFKALFPSGSVTGAPKIRSMEIIRELEKEDRRIYTGAIGYITPQKDMMFNVPIRTMLFRDNKGEMGVGGGITWYSTPQGEYDECLWKSKFITKL